MMQLERFLSKFEEIPQAKKAHTGRTSPQIRDNQSHLLVI